MVIIKLILLIIALFTTLLWVTKLMTDFATAFLGGLTDEERVRDASYRVILISIMAIVWSILIIIM